MLLAIMRSVFTIILTIILISACSGSSGTGSTEYGDPYPEQVRPCLAARDTLGADLKYAEVAGANESGDSCVVTVMFRNAEDRERFDKARRMKGLNPDRINYQGVKYPIEKSFGSVVPP